MVVSKPSLAARRSLRSRARSQCLRRFPLRCASKTRLRVAAKHKETGRLVEKEGVASSPCLLVSLSPCLRCLLVCLTTLLTGCPREGPRPTPRAQPRPSVALHLLVVNEPELAEAINRLRGEWAERSGGELTKSAKPWQEVIAQESVDADLIVFPSRYLGELCVRDWIRPIRPNVLESDDLRAADYFPLVRHELISWGGRVMALPLGIGPAVVGERIDRHPALSLLAQAAPAAMTKERIGALFDSETMQPRITERAFVDALTRLAQSTNDSTSVGPAPALSIPVLGYSDRLLAVTTSSRNAASAFQLLEWLAQADTSTQLARAGRGTMPVRRSLASSPQWYDPSLTSSERADLGKALEAALSGEQCLLIPRIPSVDNYMATLDDAVKSAVFDKVPPQVALETAAQRWEQITDAHGRDAQRQAYLKHLGIDDP